MEMPRQMVQDTVKIIESPLMGAGGHGHLALTAASYTPFANGGSIIPGITHHGAQRVGIFNRMIETVISHHSGIPLMHPQQQGSARRGANRSGGIVAAQLNSLPRQSGQGRSLELVLSLHRPAIQLLLAPVGIQVSPAHVVHQNENNIGLRSLDRPGSRLRSLPGSAHARNQGSQKNG